MARKGLLRLRSKPAAVPPPPNPLDIKAAYDAHGPELYRFALRQLGDHGAAQDVVQEVFIKAWRRIDSFDESVASLRVWLFAIARNAVIDEARRRNVRAWQTPVDTSLGFDEPAPHTTPEESMLNSWVVEEAIRKLTPEHRKVIVEVHLRGRPATEVATEQGVPVGTIRSRVFYALKALRLTMDEMGVQL